MSELIQSLTYSRQQLEEFTYRHLCELNGILEKFAISQGLRKTDLIEFLLIPLN